LLVLTDLTIAKTHGCFGKTIFFETCFFQIGLGVE